MNVTVKICKLLQTFPRNGLAEREQNLAISHSARISSSTSRRHRTFKATVSQTSVLDLVINFITTSFSKSFRHSIFFTLLAYPSAVSRSLGITFEPLPSNTSAKPHPLLPLLALHSHSVSKIFITICLAVLAGIATASPIVAKDVYCNCGLIGNLFPPRTTILVVFSVGINARTILKKSVVIALSIFLPILGVSLD